MLHLVSPGALRRGAAGKEEGKALLETPLSSSRATRNPTPSPLPALAAHQHGGAHRGSRQEVRTPGSSSSCLSFPAPALPVIKSFSDFGPQFQCKQGEDRPGPPISQSSTLPQLQSCSQGPNCLAIPVDGPCPTLQTPCQQALGLILSPRQSSSHTVTAWS